MELFDFDKPDSVFQDTISTPFLRRKCTVHR
jgi:hypothetical protein